MYYRKRRFPYRRGRRMLRRFRRRRRVAGKKKIRRVAKTVFNRLTETKCMYDTFRPTETSGDPPVTRPTWWDTDTPVVVASGIGDTPVATSSTGNTGQNYRIGDKIYPKYLTVQGTVNAHFNNNSIIWVRVIGYWANSEQASTASVTQYLFKQPNGSSVNWTGLPLSGYAIMAKLNRDFGITPVFNRVFQLGEAFNGVVNHAKMFNIKKRLRGTIHYRANLEGANVQNKRLHILAFAYKRCEDPDATEQWNIHATTAFYYKDA